MIFFLSAAVPGSAEAKEKTLVVLESKPLTWTTSSYYFLSIVHKSTVSDGLNSSFIGVLHTN